MQLSLQPDPIPAARAPERRTHAAPPQRVTRAWIRTYAVSCFLLLLPALLWNLLLTDRLPPAFQRAEFWREIPRWVSVPENALRLPVFLLPLVMPLELVTPWQRRCLGLFAAGTAVYFASWVALIAWPNSAWSTSAAGFQAPAYTPRATTPCPRLNSSGIPERSESPYPPEGGSSRVTPYSTPGSKAWPSTSAQTILRRIDCLSPSTEDSHPT